MKCLDDCHNYELENEMFGYIPEKLSFYLMSPEGERVPGTTNEEVIKALIHRLKFLNETWVGGKFYCKENDLAIFHLESALELLNKRTEDRKVQSVEGTHQP